jgi:hypothetical protein
VLKGTGEESSRKTGGTDTSAQEGTGVGPQTRREYLAKMRDCYVTADREAKSRLLDEAVAMTGRHRKSLIRAWRVGPRPGRSRRRYCRPTRYGPAIVRALIAIWTVAGPSAVSLLPQISAQIAWASSSSVPNPTHVHFVLI